MSDQLDQTENHPSGWPIAPPGIWMAVREPGPSSPHPAPRPGLFLDRDGVVVVDTGFLSDPKGVSLVPGAAALIAAANRDAVPVAVVTNQSGIDRGHYGWDAFAAVERSPAPASCWRPRVRSISILRAPG
jgi:D-glycero-D-manno-heptose 1,7-bisphosphate phosphatase